MLHYTQQLKGVKDAVVSRSAVVVVIVAVMPLCVERRSSVYLHRIIGTEPDIPGETVNQKHCNIACISKSNVGMLTSVWK